MTFTAVWAVLTPDDPDAGRRMTVTTPADVDALVEALSAPAAMPALAEQPDPQNPGGKASNVLAIGVHAGYGYLSYVGADHGYATLTGDADSPEFAAEAEEFEPGTGVDIGVVTAAVKEFLATGRRPASAPWNDPA